MSHPHTHTTEVHLRLVTSSETHTRILSDRGSLKIGRQVKTPQEKLVGTGEMTDLEQETIHKDGAIASDPIPTIPSTLTPVWFKSKVVSRSHAEIWLKDGQVWMEVILGLFERCGEFVRHVSEQIEAVAS